MDHHVRGLVDHHQGIVAVDQRNAEVLGHQLAWRRWRLQHLEIFATPQLVAWTSDHLAVDLDLTGFDQRLESASTEREKNGENSVEARLPNWSGGPVESAVHPRWLR
jgi:hypothetical protein